MKLSSEEFYRRMYQIGQPRKSDMPTNTSTKFELAADSDDLSAWTTQFVAALKSLPEHVAHSFLHRFELLLRQGVVEFAKTGDSPTVGTRHGGISIRLVGTDELLAAARAAA